MLNIAQDPDMAASGWIRKIQAANRYYEAWENRFDCDYLEDAFEGFQWTGED
jgi:hypothetical protein